MSRKKKPQPPRSAEPSNSAPGSFRPPDGLWPAAVTALLIATPLIPSESAITFGSHAVFVILWLGLLVAWSIAHLRPSHTSVRWNLTTIALLVFVLLHSISAAVMTRYGNPRHGLNQLWTVVGLIVGFLLTQQMFQSTRCCRALVQR